MHGRVGAGSGLGPCEEGNLKGSLSLPPSCSSASCIRSDGGGEGGITGPPGPEAAPSVVTFVGCLSSTFFPLRPPWAHKALHMLVFF